MSIEELYKRLCAAYTEKNLNSISSGLIACKKKGQSNLLNILLNDIKEIAAFEKNNNSFSTLIHLYHPDRLTSYRQQIDLLFKNNNFQGLDKFSHIFIAQRIEEYSETELIDNDIDYAPEYSYDFGNEGYSIFDDDTEDAVTYTNDFFDIETDKSFLGAVKRKIYGHQRIDFPVYQLEDLEDIDMAEYEIENLDGIQYCTFVESLDLSGNVINDLTPLSRCKNLKFINLSGNEIAWIDPLASLYNIRQIDLSYNYINDISPLFILQNLEYVNLLGNPVKTSQIELLEQREINIVF